MSASRGGRAISTALNSRGKVNPPSEPTVGSSDDGTDPRPEKLETEEKPLLPTDNQGLETTGNDIPTDGKEDKPSTGNDVPTEGNEASTNGQPWYTQKRFWGSAIVGAGVAIVAAPIVIGAVGFGAGGIAAGSWAASMMSAAATANGGAVAAGSLVATLQSVGAAGFGVAGLVGVGAAGATVGAAVGTGTGAVVDVLQHNGSPGDSGENPATGTNGENIELEPKVLRSDDGATSNVSLNVGTPISHSATDEVEIRIMDPSGNVQPFVVTWNEPLLRVFTEFLEITGLDPGTVRFELNGVNIDVHDTPQKLHLQNEDVVKVILL